MKKCKLCKEKDLIGKQRYFCLDCWSKIENYGKATGKWALGIAGIVIMGFINKDKIENLFNDKF